MNARALPAALALLCALAAPLPAPAQPAAPRAPSAEWLEEKGAELRARSLLRDQAGRVAEALELRELAGAQAVQAPPGAAALRLRNDMDRLRPLWILEPVDVVSAADATDRTVRLPQPVKGDQWLALAAGRWRLRAFAGAPAGPNGVEWPPLTLELRGGRAYAIDLTDQLEQTLWQSIRDRRRREELQRVNRQLPTDQPAATPPAPRLAPAPRAPAAEPESPSVTVEIQRD